MKKYKVTMAMEVEVEVKDKKLIHEILTRDLLHGKLISHGIGFGVGYGNYEYRIFGKKIDTIKEIKKMKNLPEFAQDCPPDWNEKYPECWICGEMLTEKEIKNNQKKCSRCAKKKGKNKKI